MGAKRTAELIPLCHPLPLTKVEVRIDIDDDLPGFRVTSEVRTNAVTGLRWKRSPPFPSPALPCSTCSRRSTGRWSIGGIEVTSKIGGKSGDWQRSMISFDEAVELIRSVAKPIGIETVA